ncbi:MAG: helix-hairpin-helix domain-containing protein [bacterium]
MKGYFIFYITLIIIVFCFITLEEDSTSSINRTNTITVNISGAVDFPDIYEMPKNCMLIEVYTRASLKYNAVVDRTLQYTTLQENCTIVIEYGIININTADAEELDVLDGVGASTALKIIAYREVSPFKTIEELANVSSTAYKNNYDRITV